MYRFLFIAVQLIVLGCSPKGSYSIRNGTQIGIHGGETIESSHAISNSVIFVAVAYINKETNEQESINCTGVILDRWHILTAAHCLYFENSSLAVPFVSFTPDVVNKPAEVIRAEKFKIHPDYATASKFDQLSLDIAVIKLPKELPLTAKPALLDKGTILAGKLQNLWVSGYGRSELNGDSDGKLRAASLSGQVHVSDRQIWIDSKDSCPLEGDSGGALYNSDPGALPVVVGITSTLTGDIKGHCYKHNVFTAIFPHLKFIGDTIEDLKK